MYSDILISCKQTSVATQTPGRVRAERDGKTSRERKRRTHKPKRRKAQCSTAKRPPTTQDRRQSGVTGGTQVHTVFKASPPRPPIAPPTPSPGHISPSSSSHCHISPSSSSHCHIKPSPSSHCHISPTTQEHPRSPAAPRSKYVVSDVVCVCVCDCV